MSRKRGLAAAGSIVVITLLAYIPAMRGGFVWNDDERGSLTRNIVLEENGLYRVWFTAQSVNYWPVVWTSYWIEHRLWGLDPTGYHVVNVLIHATCALLIWRILLRLEIPAAWLAALLFAVHPANVESVAWITQRKNVLALLFFLVSLLWYLRFDDCRRWAWYWAAVAAFLLAMLSKGAAAPLPAVLLLCVWWRRGTIGRRDVLRSLPFFAVALLMSGVEIWFQHDRAIGEDVIRDDTFLLRLVGAGWAVWFYAYKALVPVRLCFIYPRWEIDASSWPAYLPNLALLVALAWSWRRRQGDGRAVLFALLYYVLTLAPVLGFVNIYFMRYSLVADHYQYVSIIAIIALVAAAGRAVLMRLGHGRLSPARTVATAVVLLLGLLTWRQCQAYHDAETLWRDTLDKNPAAWMAHSNLGNILCARCDLDEAIHHYRQALDAKPDNAEVYNNLGNALALQGRPDEASDCYRQALRLNPDYTEAYNNLGLIAAKRGELDQAIEYYRRALECSPVYAKAHVNLGHALSRLHQHEDAMRHYEAAVQLDPNHDSPIPHLREALRLVPDSPELHCELGQRLVAAGQPDQALQHFRQAARLRAGWPLPLERLAWVLATHLDPSSHQQQEAIRVADNAVQLTSRQDVEALDILAAAQAAAGQFEAAIATAEEALALLHTAATSERADAIRRRLELYRQRQPYRVPTPTRDAPAP